MNSLFKVDITKTKKSENIIVLIDVNYKGNFNLYVYVLLYLVLYRCFIFDKIIRLLVCNMFG